MTTINVIMALDVGQARIGVALASLEARLPSPFRTLSHNENTFDELKQIIEAQHVTQIVVGLPRGLEGQTTQQTNQTEAFIQRLQQAFDLPIDRQDEALTSQKARNELDARGKPYAKGDIDALAATYILEDWLKQAEGDM